MRDCKQVWCDHVWEDTRPQHVIDSDSVPQDELPAGEISEEAEEWRDGEWVGVLRHFPSSFRELAL